MSTAPVCSARLSYRTHVPYGWLAVEFAHCDFSGSNASYWRSKLDAAMEQRFGKHDSEERRLFREYENLKDEYEKKLNEYNELPFDIASLLSPSKRKARRKLKSECNELVKKVEAANDRWYEKRKERSAFDEYFAYKSFLERNSFQLASENRSECNTNSEIWHLYK